LKRAESVLEPRAARRHSRYGRGIVAKARLRARRRHHHSHPAYDGGGGADLRLAGYARIIEGIRGQVDVPVYPAYPSIMTTNIDAGFSVADAAVRFAHIEALAARVLLELR